MCAAARDQREHRGGAVSGVLHELLVLIALGGPLQLGSIGQVVDHERPTACKHFGHGMASVQVEGTSPAHSLDPCGDSRIDCGSYGAADRSAPIEEIDDTQLRELGYRRPGDFSQRLQSSQRSA